jgi:cytochrome c oxidase assembly protein subunit 11
MAGFGFALVPVYNVFCDITGLNGKTDNQAAVITDSRVDTERTITVELVATLNTAAPWEFAPKVTKIQVHPGEFYQTSFFARNLTNEALVGQAIPSVAPGLAAKHFQKIECFCFSRQAFEPGEGRDMPLTFRIDPDLSTDVSTVTLSYTFFRLEDQEG